MTVLISCAKKPITLGREDPQKEIQKCMKYSQKKHFKEAVECLEIFKSHFPKSSWGIEAELLIGDNYYRQKEYLLAADSYEAFIKLNPTHLKLDYAYYKTGLSYLKHSPKAIDRDQEYLDDAIVNFEIVQRNFPDSAYLNLAKTYLLEARTRVAERHFYIGRFYYRTGEHIAAVPRFKEVINNYKDTNLAEKALHLTALSSIKLNKLDDAKDAFSILSKDYPKSKFIPGLERKLLSITKKGQNL